MTNKSSIARPYAKAAFKFAVEQHALAEWASQLNNLALLVQNEAIAALIKNPGLTREQLADLLTSIASEWLSEPAAKFVHVLAQYRRLQFLPEIAEAYAHYQAEHEHKAVVQVKTSIPLTEAQQQQLQQALAKKWDRQIELECKEDPEMLGGLLIRFGDQVIDYSLRGLLQQLQQQIVSTAT